MKTHAVRGILLLAVLAAWGAASVDAQGRAADLDLAFIDEMIVHHQGAIDEAKAIESTAKRPEVKQLATDIIKAQQAEIDQMRAWRRAWFPDAPEAPAGSASGMRIGGEAPAGMPHGPGQGAGMQHGSGRHAGGAQAPDLAFIEMMIPHHRDAVAMSQQILKTTQRPELRQLAQTIIRDQEREIALMEGWRKEWGGTTK